MTTPGPTRPPGWIGRHPGYGLLPSNDPLPERHYEPPHPPRWLFHGMCLIGAFLVFWTLSNPAPSLDDLVMPVGILVTCAVIWLVRFIVSARHGGPGMRWYAVAPVGGVLSLLLVVTHAPLQARFALADDQLAAVAETVRSEERPNAFAREHGLLGPVGTYRVHRVDVRNGLVYFTLDSCGWFGSDCGVIYAPAGVAPPVDDRSQDVERFRGPWYRWWSLESID